MRSHALLALFAVALLGLLACGAPPYPKCKTTENCNTDGHSGVCVDGMCQECGADSDCKPGFKCQDHSCKPAAECQSNTDCPLGHVCKSGKCQACQNDGECGAGNVCDQGACKPKAECKTDADCGQGKTCVDGMCQQTSLNCQTPPIHFALNDYTLSEDSRQALQKLAECLRGNAKTASVTIEGHCDERGTEEFNQSLGEKRASAAKKYLVGLGIEAARLNTVSYGKERPSDPGHTENAWAKNRRDECVQSK